MATSVLGTFENIMDLFFFIDILVGFTTSHIDPVSGDEIYSPKIIAYEYVFNGDFIIDFLSTMPFQ